MGIPNIDPARLGQVVVNRIYETKEQFIDDPVIALYNIGRYLKEDPHWGPVYVSDVVGCNYRCAHCWVADDALNGHLDSEFIIKKTSGFVNSFKGSSLHKVDDIYPYLRNKADKLENKILAFTGGETTLYRGGIKRLGELAKYTGVRIGLDTNGFQIAQDPAYLDALEGLQDVLNFYVSLKDVMFSSFNRFTGVKEEYCDHGFIAMENLLKRGFLAIPGGIVLNTFGYDNDPEFCADMLFSRLSVIHDDLPKLVSYHKISTMVHDRKAQSTKMKSRGYLNTKPSMMEKIILDKFSHKGSPILEAQPENTDIPGSILKEKILKKIIKEI